MKAILRFILAAVLALGIPGLSRAQAPMAEEYPRFSQAELDSMLAPIALYPDSLLSQMLMAATFPRDVVEAAEWSRANRRFGGQEAVRAAVQEPWDPSVKSLLAFPQVLAMMDEYIEWTERLGDAFMSNPTAVSETIQVLRARADRAGTLRSGEEVVVRRDYGNYVIEPATPGVVYVPYYDPHLAYGRWWWPDYEPMWWSPWAGYAWSPGYAGFAWGYGVVVGSGYWYTSFDWPRRYIRFSTHRPYYWRGYSHGHTHRWTSDRDHRRNARGWHWSGYAGGGHAGGGYPGREGRGRREVERGMERAPVPGPIGAERGGSSRYVAPGALSPGAVAVPSPGAGRRIDSSRASPQAPLQRLESAPPPRAFERAPQAPSVAPQPVPAQPMSRPAERSFQRAPAPAPAPSPAPAPAARDPDPPQSDSRSQPAPESRSDAARSGASRAGGRAVQF